jgi:hypothetical protein
MAKRLGALRKTRPGSGRRKPLLAGPGPSTAARHGTSRGRSGGFCSGLRRRSTSRRTPRPCEQSAKGGNGSVEIDVA